MNISKTLSISIITKNEENNIDRCINSIKNIADEIVIVDTGSTDKTIEKAKRLGAKVYSYKWNNNFSEAKNCALAKCTKDWILVLDADEAIEKGYGDIIKKVINSTENKEAYYMQLNNIIGIEIINENPTLRLFKNRKEYRYVGRLHEQIFNSIENLYGKEAFGSTNIIINHYGYDHNIVDMSKKHDRNIEILNGYPEEEKDSTYYFGLASEHMKSGNNLEARDAFIKSIEIGEEGGGAYAYISIVQSSYLLKEYITASNYVDKFINKYRDFRDLYFLKAVCNNEIGRYSKSHVALTIYKTLQTNINKYPSFSFDTTNNIDGLITALGNLRVLHEANLITTLINIDNKYDNYTDIIRSVNEISENVIVITDINDKEILKGIKEFGATPYKKSEFDKNQLIKSKWIFEITEPIVLTTEDNINIVNIIKKCIDEGKETLNIIGLGDIYKNN